MPVSVALLRGINVGRATTISMAELSRVFLRLGFADVSTVVRSGNVVFRSHDPIAADTAATIEAAVLEATGVQSSVFVRDAAAFIDAVEANPLLGIATDGSRNFVTFATRMPATLLLPDAAALAPEVLAVGPAAVYQWIPDGLLKTRVPKSFWRQFEAPVTARNWNTLQKVRAALAG